MKRCARCDLGISSNEMVMRARDYVYHLTCFTCASCDRPLATGDHFGLRDCVVYCDEHYDIPLCDDIPLRGMLNTLSGPAPASMHGAFYNGVGATHKGRPRKRKSHGIESELCIMPLGESAFTRSSWVFIVVDVVVGVGIIINNHHLVASAESPMYFF